MVGNQQQVLSIALDFHQAQPNGPQLFSSSQLYPSMAQDSCTALGRTQDQFLLAINHRAVTDAENEKSAGMVALCQKLVILTVITIGDVSLTWQKHLSQRLSFTAITVGDQGILRTVLAPCGQPHTRPRPSVVRRSRGYHLERSAPDASDEGRLWNSECSSGLSLQKPA